MERIFSNESQLKASSLKKNLTGYIAINCSVLVAVLIVAEVLRNFAPSVSTQIHGLSLLTIVLFSKPTEMVNTESNFKITSLPRFIWVLSTILKTLAIAGWVYYISLVVSKFGT